MPETDDKTKSQGHVRPHPDAEPKQRLGEHPPTQDEQGRPLGNSQAGTPPAFPPHN